MPFWSKIEWSIVAELLLSNDPLKDLERRVEREIVDHVLAAEDRDRYRNDRLL